jgi:bla regulator protein blaR1
VVIAGFERLEKWQPCSAAIRLLVVLIAATSSAAGQSFEVAAIRPYDPDRRIQVASTGGGFYASITLKYMIQVAYDVAPYQVSGGPEWVDKEVWDVTASAEGFAGEIPLESLRPMLRELIRDRFQLRLREGKQNLPYFALVVDKKGSKLERSASSLTNFHLERGPSLRWTKVSMRSFASWLEPWIQAGRVVLDETGLPGDFDIELHWAGQPMTAAPINPRDATQIAEPAGPTIFTALREQLGLRLESRRGPVQNIRSGARGATSGKLTSVWARLKPGKRQGHAQA